MSELTAVFAVAPKRMFYITGFRRRFGEVGLRRNSLDQLKTEVLMQLELYLNCNIYVIVYSV